MCRKHGVFFLCGCYFLCFRLDGSYVFSCSIADDLRQLGGSDGFLHFAQRCLWQSAVLKFASCRFCASTAFLCCRKESHSQHRTEDMVMYVKEDAAARPAS